MENIIVFLVVLFVSILSLSSDAATDYGNGTVVIRKNIEDSRESMIFYSVERALGSRPEYVVKNIDDLSKSDLKITREDIKCVLRRYIYDLLESDIPQQTVARMLNVFTLIQCYGDDKDLELLGKSIVRMRDDKDNKKFKYIFGKAIESYMVVSEYENKSPNIGMLRDPSRYFFIHEFYKNDFYPFVINDYRKSVVSGNIYMRRRLLDIMRDLAFNDDFSVTFSMLDSVLIEEDPMYMMSDKRRDHVNKIILNEDKYNRPYLLFIKDTQLSENAKKEILKIVDSAEYCPKFICPDKLPAGFPFSLSVWKALARVRCQAEFCMDEGLLGLTTDFIGTYGKSDIYSRARAIRLAAQPEIRVKRCAVFLNELVGLGNLLNEDVYNAKIAVMPACFDKNLLEMAMDTKKHPERYQNVPMTITEAQDLLGIKKSSGLYDPSIRSFWEIRLVGFVDLNASQWLLHKDSRPTLSFVFKRTCACSSDCKLLFMSRCQIIESLSFIPCKENVKEIGTCLSVWREKSDKESSAFSNTFMSLLLRNNGVNSSLMHTLDLLEVPKNDKDSLVDWYLLKFSCSLRQNINETDDKYIKEFFCQCYKIMAVKENNEKSESVPNYLPIQWKLLL